MRAAAQRCAMRNACVRTGRAFLAARRGDRPRACATFREGWRRSWRVANPSKRRPHSRSEMREPAGSCRPARHRAASSSISTAEVRYRRGARDPRSAARRHRPRVRRARTCSWTSGSHRSIRFRPRLDDCFAVWNLLLSAGIDPARVVFAGDSAGGNLAVVTAMRARDEGLPLPAAIVLMSPVLDLDVQRRFDRAQ